MHGDVCGYLRDKHLNAQNALSQTLLPYTQLQSGVSVGGPIVKNRTFYFANFEQRQLNQTGIITISELIESLLFLARSESPGDHLKRTDEDIGAILTDLRDYYEAACAEVGVQMSISVGGNAIVANLDRTLLLRALGNLVSNALAHCSTGDAIWLSARRENGQIYIEVRDTGSGIPADALPRVFDRLYRADPARSRNSGGSGIGLGYRSTDYLPARGRYPDFKQRMARDNRVGCVATSDLSNLSRKYCKVTWAIDKKC